MASSKKDDITAEEFRGLMREINTRMILAGLVLIAFGLLVSGLVALLAR